MKSTLFTLILLRMFLSYNAANYGTKLLRHTGAFTNVSAMDANSTEDSDFRVLRNPEKSGLLVLSQSGETKDVVDVVQLAQRNNVPVVSIVNGVESTIANMTKCGVYTNAGEEVAAPSTKSFTTQVVCLALVAMWFRQMKAKEKGVKKSSEVSNLGESLQRLPITFGMLMRTQSVCKKAAKKLLSKEHCFVLGKGMLQLHNLILLQLKYSCEISCLSFFLGFGEPIAMEGALKLKEIGYLHAEGYSGGALKVSSQFWLLAHRLTHVMGSCHPSQYLILTCKLTTIILFSSAWAIRND